MRVLLGSLMLAAIAACASVGNAPSVDRNLVTAREMEQMGSANVYQALERLRPEFIRRNRGRQSINLQAARTVVYIDNARFEELDALRTIPSSAVESIRFLDGRDAVTRFGNGHEAGALIVTLKRG
jgi:hypothetical protein